MNFAKMAVLLAFILTYGSATAQQSISAASAETPKHFMRGVLQLATSGSRGLEILDGSETVYTPGFLDAMFGEGCFTEHRPCIVDHLMRARICGCYYDPKNIEKKGDPTCGCPARLKFSELSIARANANGADVSARLNLRQHEKDKVTWHLLMTPQGWRIDDVSTSDIPSLKARMSR
jgi:rubredoxin